MSVTQHRLKKASLEEPSQTSKSIHLKTRRSAAGAALIVFFMINIVVFLAPPKWDSESGLAGSIDKHARLEACRSPKIVFIGGSNVLLGIDSAAVQKALNRDVVNMGMGISLGLRYQLEEVRDQLKPGDLFVVMPEYCNFYSLSKDITNAHFNGSSDLIHVFQVHPQAWRWIWSVYSSSPSALFDGVDDIRRFQCFKAKFYKRVLGEIIHDPNRIWSPELLKPTNTLFTHRKYMNCYGDFVGHLQQQPPHLLPSEPIAFSDYKKFNKEATDFLNDYQSFAKSKGATLVILPPVFPGHLRCNTITMDIYQHWKKLLKIPVLASPERYSFEWSELFDSEYHTNAIGRRRRTAMVIEDLNKFLADSSRAHADIEQKK